MFASGLMLLLGTHTCYAANEHVTWGGGGGTDIVDVQPHSVLEQ
jgi:hypothetical protein